MLREVKETSRVQEIKTNKLKVLAYGQSGSGKTCFAGTFPNSYFYDTDNGMLSLRNSKNKIEFDTYNDADLSKPKAILEIDKKTGELQKDCPYDTIVVDGITTIADLAMNRILFNNGRAGGVPQQQDWLQQMNWIKNFIVTLLALPKHIVVLAHEQIEKDENFGSIKALPLVTGKLAGKIGLFFDEVYNSQAVTKGKETDYRLLTKSTSVYTAKSRLGCFDMYEKPDFAHLMAKVEEENELHKKAPKQ